MAESFEQGAGQGKPGAPGASGADSATWGQSAPQAERVYDPVSGSVVSYTPPDHAPTQVAPTGVQSWVGMSPGASRVGVAAPPAPPSAPVGPRSSGGVSRRALLVGAGVGAVGVGAAGVGLGAVLLTRRQTGQGATLPNLLSTDAAKINHLLRRAGFGPTPSEVGDYLAAGVQGSIDRLLNYASIPDDLNNRLGAIPFDFTNPQDLIRWWLLRMLYSKHPLEEKMTLFWAGVLTSSFAKVGRKNPYLITQNQMLRAKGLGRFDDLIHDISSDPAMLYWLDGRASTGQSPNENYARELMELFTLGIADVHGKPNYTQDDVHGGALALAGWVDQNGHGVLVPARAYHGQATFLGKTGNLGLADVVKLVCAHPATGRFIAWRMWRFFAYNTTLDDPVLQPLADAYYKNDHNIGAMARAMLTSADFFSAKAYRGRIKSPVEFVVGAIRALGLQLGYNDLKNFPALLQQMGQVLFDPPNVSGWDGDKDSANWLGTQNWMSRVNFINTLAAAATGTAAGGRQQTATSGSPAQQLITTYRLKSPEDVASYLLAALADNTVTDDRRALLGATLAQSASGPTLSLVGGAKIAAVGMRQALYLMMSMPEFQLS
jgi:hypothetical protein